MPSLIKKILVCRCFYVCAYIGLTSRLLCVVLYAFSPFSHTLWNKMLNNSTTESCCIVITYIKVILVFIFVNLSLLGALQKIEWLCLSFQALTQDNLRWFLNIRRLPDYFTTALQLTVELKIYKNTPISTQHTW